MAFRISEIKDSRGKSPLVVIPKRTTTRCREGMTTKGDFPLEAFVSDILKAIPNPPPG